MQNIIDITFSKISSINELFEHGIKIFSHDIFIRSDRNLQLGSRKNVYYNRH